MEKNTAKTNMDTTKTDIGNCATVQEAIMLLDDLQDSLLEHYSQGLRRISDLLIDNCEDMQIEYDETVHLLQMLSQLRQDLQAIMQPRTTSAAMEGSDM